MRTDVVYFSVNNWWCGEDYPNDEPFIKWLKDDLKIFFMNENWVKDNKLCVKWGIIDMSFNFCITATREWVENNCPKLLTNEEYKYGKDSRLTKKFSDFVYTLNENGELPEDRFGWTFLEYCDENIGCTKTDEDY